MRRLAIILGWVAAASAAQENAPIGILRGDLVAWSGTARAGLLTFRNPDNSVFACGFDDKTWFEHENERIAFSAMREGDHLELVADHQPRSAACYARSVQILDAIVPRRTAAGKPSLRSHNSATELFAPRGDMTLAGIVMAVDGNWLTLLTRDKARHVLYLRPDTRYLGAGLRQERSSLYPQTLVFVRAGRNLNGDIEVYTVMWGDILHVQN